MLIDTNELGEITNTSLLKAIKKINQFDAKGKKEKLESALLGLRDFIKDKNSEETRIVILIYSLLIEDFPFLLSKKLLKNLDDLLSSSNDETRLNAVILYGIHLQEQINNKDEKEIDIDKFLNFLDDSVIEIKKNVLFFIEQFPPRYLNYLLQKTPALYSILDETEDEEILEVLFFIFEKIWNQTLDVKLEFFNDFIERYLSYSSPIKREMIMKFLAKDLADLNEYLEETNWKLTDENINNYLKKRAPLIKVYDIEEIASAEGMDGRKVEQHFLNLPPNEKIFRFILPAKQRFFIEIEIDPFIELISRKKVRIEELIKIFGDSPNLDTISLLNLLIKKLVKGKRIQGFLSRAYFYPYSVIKKDLLRAIQQNGEINIDSFSRNINYEFVLKIIDDINRETKFKGIFTKDKAIFLTLNSIINKIEKKCIKDSIFDLTLYKEKYQRDDFDLIEEQCQKHFFTEFHSGNKWLTNIGYTRLTERFKKAQIIGYLNIEKIAESEDIPEDLAREILNKWLEGKPGLWNNSNNAYYFTKFIKEKIGKMDKTLSEEEKEKKIEEVAQEMNLDPELIREKLNQEIEQIIRQIRTKNRIDINKYCRLLGFKRDKFIKFVDNLKIEYLIIEKWMIFDKKEIEKKRNFTKKLILEFATKRNRFFIKELVGKTKFGANMIVGMIKEFLKEGKIKGILLNDDMFIGLRGIKNRILKNKDIITMETLFPDDKLTEEDQNLVISVLEELINSGELIGEYDPDSKEFRSEEEWDRKLFENEKITAQDMRNFYVGAMKDTFEKIRKIYMNKKDIKIGDIKKKDYLMHRVRSEWNNWEKNLKRQVDKVTTDYNSADDVGDLSFGDILDSEKQKDQVDEEVIMGDFYKWKDILQDLDGRLDEIGRLKKDLLQNPNDEALLQELQKIYEEVHFFEDFS